MDKYTRKSQMNPLHFGCHSNLHDKCSFVFVFVFLHFQSHQFPNRRPRFHHNLQYFIAVQMCKRKEDKMLLTLLCIFNVVNKYITVCCISKIYWASFFFFWGIENGNKNIFEDTKLMSSRFIDKIIETSLFFFQQNNNNKNQ